MTALRIFKKKEKSANDVEKKNAKSASSADKEALKAEGAIERVEKKDEQKTAVASGDSQIVRPHITEKATDLASKNQYVFVVQSRAAKKEIEKSVEKMYGVEVEGVRIINVHPKKMRMGRIEGVKKGYKKAIVKIKEGQSIEIFPT